jgi:hypothetical protein
MWHGIGNIVAMALFGISWWLRLPQPTAPHWAAIILCFIGVGHLLITGWLGGELIHRLNVSNDAGANLNAPSSLSGRPATDTADDTDIRKGEPVLPDRGDTRARMT